MKAPWHKKAFQLKANRPLSIQSWGDPCMLISPYGYGGSSCNLWLANGSRGSSHNLNSPPIHPYEQNDRQTHTTENSTFPQIFRLRAKIKALDSP